MSTLSWRIAVGLLAGRRACPPASSAPYSLSLSLSLSLSFSRSSVTSGHQGRLQVKEGS